MPENKSRSHTAITSRNFPPLTKGDEWESLVPPFEKGGLGAMPLS